MAGKSKAKMSAKQAENVAKLPKYQPLSWEHYAGDVDDLSKASREELQCIVRKAAKAANQRLRSLEQKGLSMESHAYKYAQSTTGKERPRFNERPKADIMTLRHQAAQLREYMTLKTSTPTGVRAARAKGYETAKAAGFSGSVDQWAVWVEKFFAKVREGLLSSDVAYQAITQNNTDLLQEMIEEWNRQEHYPSRGKQLVDYLMRRRE